jgi:DNA primase
MTSWRTNSRHKRCRGKKGRGALGGYEKNVSSRKHSDQEEELTRQRVELCLVHPQSTSGTNSEKSLRTCATTAASRKPPRAQNSARRWAAASQTKGPKSCAEQEQQQRQGAAQEQERRRRHEEQTKGPRREQQRRRQESPHPQNPTPEPARLAAAREPTAEPEGEGRRDERPPKRLRRAVGSSPREARLFFPLFSADIYIN